MIILLLFILILVTRKSQNYTNIRNAYNIPITTRKLISFTLHPDYGRVDREPIEEPNVKTLRFVEALRVE